MPELIHNVWEVLRVDLVELPLHRWAAEQKLYLAHTICPFVPGGGLVKNDVLVEGFRSSPLETQPLQTRKCKTMPQQNLKTKPECATMVHEKSVSKISKAFPSLAVSATSFFRAVPCQSDHWGRADSPHFPLNLNILPCSSAAQSIKKIASD